MSSGSSPSSTSPTVTSPITTQSTSSQSFNFTSPWTIAIAVALLLILIAFILYFIYYVINKRRQNRKLFAADEVLSVQDKTKLDPLCDNLFNLEDKETRQQYYALKASSTNPYEARNLCGNYAKTIIGRSI